MSRANERAFPHDYAAAESRCGLTIREHFAAMAMQGILANEFMREQINKACASQNTPYISPQELAASMSARYADALVAELEKK